MPREKYAEVVACARRMGSAATDVAHSCFDLTPRERRALSLVLALLMLGMGARTWLLLKRMNGCESRATTASEEVETGDKP